MPDESATLSSGWNSARETLAEIRACQGNLQTFLSRVFDQRDQVDRSGKSSESERKSEIHCWATVVLSPLGVTGQLPPPTKWMNA
jgi:hypothetical protein